MKNVKEEQKQESLPEELQERFETLSKRLGFYISALNVPQETKDLWLSFLSKMSLEQMERLADVFEQEYLEEETQYINEEFKKVLDEIEKERKEKLNKIDEETIQRINDLTKKITG